MLVLTRVEADPSTSTEGYMTYLPPAAKLRASQSPLSAWWALDEGHAAVQGVMRRLQLASVALLCSSVEPTPPAKY